MGKLKPRKTKCCPNCPVCAPLGSTNGKTEIALDADGNLLVIGNSHEQKIGRLILIRQMLKSDTGAKVFLSELVKTEAGLKTLRDFYDETPALNFVVR